MDKREYRCECGGKRHKCDILRIKNLELAEKEARKTIDRLCAMIPSESCDSAEIQATGK